ncbi:MAG: transposase [Nanoarchaeota archaeon]|nr:transposase [Nanoarchaeota archaeon]
MKKEVKLVNKIKRLLKQLKCPKYRNHFGPKTYEFYVHLIALLTRAYCRLSYRRVVYFMDLIGIRCPSKSALQYVASRISSNFWNKLLEITSGIEHQIIALDATGFSRTNPSFHYLRRIDGKMPKDYVKLSVAFDVKQRKFCAGRIRVKLAHDIKDVKYLLTRVIANILVADKSYDAYWVHDYCTLRRMEVHIPLRKTRGKSTFKSMSNRVISIGKFDEEIYGQRSLEESGFGSVKRKLGNSVNSKKAPAIRSDLYSRLVCYNIFLGSVVI